MESLLASIGSAVTPQQRDALATPLRLEIFSHFASAEPLSARELAERMGRSPSSLYYHLHQLLKVGLLREAGERPRGTRTETLYQRAASALRLEPDGSAATREAILRTMTAAFRMAERDLEAALDSETTLPETPASATRTDGAPVFATRLHFRATSELLDEVRRHLTAALEVLERSDQQGPSGPEAGPHFSLTLALLPLRGREPAGEIE